MYWFDKQCLYTSQWTNIHSHIDILIGQTIELYSFRYIVLWYRKLKCYISSGVRVTHLEAVNHAVGRSSSDCAKLTKSLQQTSANPNIAGSFRSKPKLGGPMYHNDIVGTLRIEIFISHTLGKCVSMLPGVVSPNVLHNASIQFTLTVEEVVGTKNQVTLCLLAAY